MKKTVIGISTILLSVALVLVVALTVYWKTHSNRMRPIISPTVGVSTVKASLDQEKLIAVGTMVAVQGTTLKTQVSGLVTKINFKSGSAIKKGQALVELNPDILKSQLNYNIAQMTLSKINYLRDKKLIGSKAISQSDLDTAEATYKSNLAQMKEAEAKLAQSYVVAPFSGKLGLREVHLGDYLQSGDTITTLDQTSPLWVDFSVPAKYFGSLKIGQAVSVNTDSHLDQALHGKLIATSSKIDSDSNNISLRALVDNPKTQVLPGELVKITLYLTSPETKLTVPQTAVMYSLKGTYVYVVKKNRIIKTSVTVGKQIKQNLEITQGLQKGESVVIDGTNKVHDGQVIKTVASEIA